jgi:hypothetical protein
MIRRNGQEEAKCDEQHKSKNVLFPISPIPPSPLKGIMFLSSDLGDTGQSDELPFLQKRTKPGRRAGHPAFQV